MKGAVDDGKTVNSVETAFAIVELLDKLGGAGVSELASRLDLAKSTVHRHLTTLERLEYVKNESGVYEPSLRFFEIGERAKNRDPVYSLSTENVDELAAETGERAQFFVEEFGRAVYMYTARGKHAVQTNPEYGNRTPIHALAAGKVILANMPEDRVAEIVDRHGLPALTQHTITDPDELEAELSTIRDRGYGFNRQESIEGLNAVAAPIIGPDGRVRGALSISGPTRRLEGDVLREEIPDLLLGVTNEIELNLAHE